MAYQFTQQDYYNLKKAIASGALEVKYGDKWIKYQTTDQMIKVLGLIEQELGLSNKGGRIKVYISNGKD